MNRIHHTNRKTIRIPYSVSYTQKIDFKPSGLWYGTDWAWEDWCKSNMPQWQHKNHFELDLDLNKILLIDTGDKLKEFAEEFGEAPEWAKQIKNNTKYIDWAKVAEKYCGIEINPYQYKFRLNPDFMWYYGWDIASGCIWNLSAIKSFKPATKKILHQNNVIS